MRRDLVTKLEALKRELKVESYDEVIRVLVREHRRVPTSYFGKYPGLPEFVREEIDRFD